MKPLRSGKILQRPHKVFHLLRIYIRSLPPRYQVSFASMCTTLGLFWQSCVLHIRFLSPRYSVSFTSVLGLFCLYVHYARSLLTLLRTPSPAAINDSTSPSSATGMRAIQTGVHFQNLSPKTRWDPSSLSQSRSSSVSRVESPGSFPLKSRDLGTLTEANLSHLTPQARVEVPPPPLANSFVIGTAVINTYR